MLKKALDIASIIPAMLNKLGAVSIFSILTPAVFAQCNNNGLRDGLIARYTFDGGLATDTSGLNNNGQVTNAPPISGISGIGLHYLDNSSYVQVPDSLSLNPVNGITVSAWWFSESFSGTGSDPIVDKGASCHCPPYYQYHLSVVGDQYGNTPGAIGFLVNTTAGNVGTNTPPNTWTPGHWYHCVGTYDGSRARLYLNGTLVATSSAVVGQLTSLGRPMFIGHFSNLANSLRGTVDEVRIFSRALSADEISYFYQHPDDSPGFSQQPHSQVFCRGNASTFTATLSGATPISYQWFKDMQPLNDSATISGSHTATLTITNAQTSDAGIYRLQILTSCGTFSSTGASLQVCPANFNCDESVDFFDYLDFVDAFASNSPSSDFNYDGVIDFFDYLDFVDAFSTGC